MHITDSHCHFDEAIFDADREQALARARKAGVRTLILPAISARFWSRLRTVTRAHDGLYAAYGLHPLCLENHRPEHLEELDGWLEREQPVAVGECGLDFYVEGLDPERQNYYFTEQIRLARHHGLPLIVHVRRSVDQVIKYLRRFPGVQGVAHSFSGSQQQACKLIDLGFLLGVGGPITYPRARRLRRLVATLPLESLMVETDSPDQPLQGHQGQRNEPACSARVLETVAQLRGQDPQVVAETTTANAYRLFGIR
ncbi:MAG: TatD family hydrolase [Candidatus Competibacteraceae bacterium]|nr:TatD family hydrolase [Candidatus Competibacteraceae bacterium]